MMAEKITERTLYTILINIIKEHGGTAISEVKFNSQPDIASNVSSKTIKKRK